MRVFKGWIHTHEGNWNRVFGWYEGEVVYKALLDILELDTLKVHATYTLTANQLEKLHAKIGLDNSFYNEGFRNAIEYLKTSDEKTLIFHVETLI